ncbi:MAG: toll/interleukin-1 receptor domain-containing protein [Dehalococcoidia bacterium]
MQRFDFAISFAQGDRALAAELAGKLTEQGFVVFYDRLYRSHLVGRRLNDEFERIYGAGTRFFVPLVSREYRERDWPQFEWSIAHREAQRRDAEFILPIRLDDTALLGLPDDMGYLDLRELSIDEVVDALTMKYRAVRGGGLLGRAPHEESWVATLGVLVTQLVSSDLLPESAPRDYASLCDWLEDELLGRLAAAPIRNPRFTEASGRNGEDLSVRVAFEWTPGRDALSFGDLGWWEILELSFEQAHKEE